MPKSDDEIRILHSKHIETTKNFSLFQAFYDGHRLAESEKESEIALLSSSNLSLKQAAKHSAEKYEKLVERLKLQLNILYLNIPTGTVDAFEMIKLVKNHYESLESLITEIEGGDNGKAEG